MAQNLRVRTRKTRPEREHIPTWQDKKNKLLKRLTFSRVSRSQQSASLPASARARRGGGCQIGHGTWRHAIPYRLTRQEAHPATLGTSCNLLLTTHARTRIR